ncbi:MAG: hypothetical protein AB1847_10050 [bacterium]
MEWFYKSSRITCFILLLVGSVFLSASVWALDPTVTDVTTRSFSVVWTESTGGLGVCSLSVRKSGGAAVDGSQIILESDADAQARGVIKFEVIGLDYGTTYSYTGTRKNSGTFSGTVTTALFRGLLSSDPNANDIVTNDIFHVAVFNTDGKTPALGTLVMADIYTDAGCTTKKNKYPLTGWVGFGMPGNIQAADYTGKSFAPTNISYREYAALNLNNLFADDPSTPNVVDLFPLQLTGDDPGTAGIVEGSYLKVSVVPGITPVAGDMVQVMPVPAITRVGNQTISSAKVTAAIKFGNGLNAFSYPCEVPEGYTTGTLLDALESVGGQVSCILSYDGVNWKKTDKVFSRGKWVTRDAVKIDPGKGYLVLMKEAMTKPLYISGYPATTQFSLNQNMNICGFPQIPSFYSTKDLLESIDALGDQNVNFILTYDGANWTKTDKVFSRGKWVVRDSKDMKRGMGYFVFLKNAVSNVDPLKK